MKENEQTLKNEIGYLKNQLNLITVYLELQKQLIEGQADNPGAYSHTFYSQQQVQIGFISQEQSINVYVDVGNGSYKQIHPIISDLGGQTQLDFDMPYTGYAIIGAQYMATAIVLPPTPVMLPTDEIVLLEEPEPEEPIIRTGIHDTWQR